MFILKGVSIILFVFVFHICSFAQFSVDTSRNMYYILNSFSSNTEDIIIDNIKSSGNRYALGMFNNQCPYFPLSEGIIISTGDVWDVIGPNDKVGSGVDRHFPGDSELEKLANGKTYDAAIIEFDFIANSDSVSFDYIFASEEYPEYVNKGLNDVFAFFISDTVNQSEHNIAYCNNMPITVDNLNSSINSEFFIPNEEFVLGRSNCLSYSIQFDGMSVQLSTGFRTIPYQKYHFKLCISDVGDGKYDSAIFLRSKSFASSGTINMLEIGERIKPGLDNEHIYFYSDSANILFIPNILFEFDSFSIPEKSYTILNRINRILKRFYDFKIDILGYTDNTGSDDYNLDLSLKRAESIANYLTKHDIEEDRIRTFGFGKKDPISDNSEMEGRAKNRRVVMRFYK